MKLIWKTVEDDYQSSRLEGTYDALGITYRIRELGKDSVTDKPVYNAYLIEYPKRLESGNIQHNIKVGSSSDLYELKEMCQNHLDIVIEDWNHFVTVVENWDETTAKISWTRGSNINELLGTLKIKFKNAEKTLLLKANRSLYISSPTTYSSVSVWVPKSNYSPTGSYFTDDSTFSFTAADNEFGGLPVTEKQVKYICEDYIAKVLGVKSTGDSDKEVIDTYESEDDVEISWKYLFGMWLGTSNVAHYLIKEINGRYVSFANLETDGKKCYDGIEIGVSDTIEEATHLCSNYNNKINETWDNN